MLELCLQIIFQAAVDIVVNIQMIWLNIILCEDKWWIKFNIKLKFSPEVMFQSRTAPMMLHLHGITFELNTCSLSLQQPVVFD